MTVSNFVILVNFVTNLLFKWMYSQSTQIINNNLTLLNYIKLLVIYIAYS